MGRIPTVLFLFNFWALLLFPNSSFGAPCTLQTDLIVSAPCDLAEGSYSFNSLTITSTGTITANFTVTITATTLVIQSSGALISIGNPAATGPGKATASNSDGRGAGHGGDGGDGNPARGSGNIGLAYGNLRTPTAVGSGGGNNAYLLEEELEEELFTLLSLRTYELMDELMPVELFLEVPMVTTVEVVLEEVSGSTVILLLEQDRLLQMEVLEVVLMGGEVLQAELQSITAPQHTMVK